ncbi:MAG: hypothetical protein R2701_01125 [Acidimicrobiales bacterium]
MSTSPEPAQHDHDDEFDRGLAYDLGTLSANFGRRRMLGLVGGAAAAVALAACGSSSSDGSSTTTAAASATTATTAASSGGPGGGPPSGGGGGAAMETPEGQIPEETNGPYPADGTNGVDVLTTDGIVRKDITSSFGDASGTADGVPLTVEFVVTDTDGNALEGYAVYAWHCTADCLYSMYSDSVTDENFLRGIQAADSKGLVTFTSIFPGCYSGRWPHIHFEVYESVDSATSGGDRISTSQLAFPADICNEIYDADSRYSASVSNLSRLTLETDSIFADSWEEELGTMSGSVDDGLTVRLDVPIAV